MRTTGLPVLAKILDGQLRTGVTEIDLVRSMNASIAAAPADEEAWARRSALLSASGALYGVLSRLRIAALLSGRWHRAWQLSEARWDVTDFAMELGRADQDPDADILRVQLLGLTLQARSTGPAPQVGAALGSMSRVAFAGTTPLG